VRSNNEARPHRCILGLLSRSHSGLHWSAPYGGRAFLLPYNLCAWTEGAPCCIVKTQQSSTTNPINRASVRSCFSIWKQAQDRPHNRRLYLSRTGSSRNVDDVAHLGFFERVCAEAEVPASSALSTWCQEIDVYTALPWTPCAAASRGQASSTSSKDRPMSLGDPADELQECLAEAPHACGVRAPNSRADGRLKPHDAESIRRLHVRRWKVHGRKLLPAGW